MPIKEVHMKKEEIIYLKQLFGILGNKIDILKKTYEDKNEEKFNKIKKEIIETQKKISSTIK